MKLLELVEDGGYWWAIIETARGVITFTLNDDGTIYALSPDGGALQDAEREFMSDASADEIAALHDIRAQTVPTINQANIQETTT